MAEQGELAERKRELRRSYRQRLAAGFCPEQRQSWDQAICRQLVSVLPDEGGRAAAFWSLKEEPKVLPELAEVPGWSWCLPRVVGDGLEFFPFLGIDQLVEGKLGVMEPARSGPAVAADQLRVMLVPGLAFDRRGFRLGRGKGFYDRTLARFAGLKVGVAYAAQIHSEELPHDERDVPVDVLVTENFILQPKR